MPGYTHYNFGQGPDIHPRNREALYDTPDVQGDPILAGVGRSADGAKQTFADVLAMPSYTRATHRRPPAGPRLQRGSRHAPRAGRPRAHLHRHSLTTSPVLAACLTAMITFSVSSPSRPLTTGFSSPRITRQKLRICRASGSCFSKLSRVLAKGSSQLRFCGLRHDSRLGMLSEPCVPPIR